MKLTQDRLKELLDYSSADGLFVWRTNSNSKKGKVAGTVNGQGYVAIPIDGQRYVAHRLAFLWMEGVFPPDQVDHINRVRSDNRWENLRPATHGENSRNTAARCASGHKGVYQVKSSQKWRARITINGKECHLGNFKRVEDAAAAYTSALQTLKG